LFCPLSAHTHPPQTEAEILKDADAAPKQAKVPQEKRKREHKTETVDEVSTPKRAQLNHEDDVSAVPKKNKKEKTEATKQKSSAPKTAPEQSSSSSPVHEKAILKVPSPFAVSVRPKLGLSFPCCH
jgi:hypothetical protein